MTDDTLQIETKLLSPRFGQRVRDTSLDCKQKEHLSIIEHKFKSGEYSTCTHTCKWCASSSFLRISEYDLFGLPAAGSICKTCGLFTINPRLDEPSSKDFFENHFSFMLYGGMSEDRKFAKSKIWCGRYLVDVIARQKLAQPGDLILDVGCGSGGVVSALREAGYNAVGIDIDRNAIIEGQIRGLPLAFRSDNELAPVGPHKPQIILYVFCLEYIEELRSELNKIHGLLHPEGYLIVMGHRLYRPILRGQSLTQSLRFYLKHYFSQEVLENIVQSVGFRRIQERRSLNFLLQKPRVSYTCIFRKTSQRYTSKPVDYLGVYRKLVTIELLCSIVGRLRKFLRKTLFYVKRYTHYE